MTAQITTLKLGSMYEADMGARVALDVPNHQSNRVARFRESWLHDFSDPQAWAAMIAATAGRPRIGRAALQSG